MPPTVRVSGGTIPHAPTPDLVLKLPHAPTMASTISGPSDNDALLAQILSLTGPAQDVLIANVAAVIA